MRNLILAALFLVTTKLYAAFSIPPTHYQLKNDYSHLDQTRLIQQVALSEAVNYYDYNLENIRNKRYITLIDFSMHASKRRMFVVDVISGQVKAMLTSVGRGSDPDNDGYADADSFSNLPNSHKSSLGFYNTADTYIGKHGKSLRLHGLSETNSLAYERAIVIHSASYVNEAQSRAGRSHGCPAVDPINLDWLIDNTKNGSLLYIFY